MFYLDLKIFRSVTCCSKVNLRLDICCHVVVGSNINNDFEFQLYILFIVSITYLLRMILIADWYFL